MDPDPSVSGKPRAAPASQPSPPSCWQPSFLSRPRSTTIFPSPTSSTTAIRIAGAYKFAVLWSGQEGSLLFWSLLLAAYGFVLRLRYKTDPRLFAYASVIIAAVQVFFLLLLNFAAHPFAIQRADSADGNGLNPLLQYPEMVIHPPMLYLGYVGFTVPFAFALGALIMRYPGEKWIHITRRWTMVTWGFLTIGIFLGAHWAYAVLGWGGYWGWDPVENASLMPWLTGTAFLHSVMMQEKRGMLKSLEHVADLRHVLTLRSSERSSPAVASSVRSMPLRNLPSELGSVVFMGLTLATFACFFCHEQVDTCAASTNWNRIVSRESSFLFNNLLFVMVCFTVLWGTFFPIISEWVQGTKVTVGPPFFNQRRSPGRAAASAAHRSWPAAGLAQDFAREPQAKFHLARDRRPCRRRS